MGLIRIVPYDARWPAMYEREVLLLRSQLGPLAVRIDHVGSTSVPGLASKPVIDIQVSVPALDLVDAYRSALEALGYGFVSVGDFDRVYPFFCKPHEWPATHHVHLCEAGREQERRHLAFRDLLRAHADVAAEYLEMKLRLAAEHPGESFASREAYSLAKSAFVEAAIERALAEGLPKPASPAHG